MAIMRGPTSPLSVSARRSGFVVALVAVAIGAIASAVACGSEPVGVEACQKIERVRCESAPGCGINLDRPLHSGKADKDNVAACIRYYDDQCLHGLVVTKEPGPQAVDACVNAIINGDCSVVKAPENHPDCSFLNPPKPAPAAADAEAEAAAAATDGGTT
jgi:hypothetical protein